jgi:hypothetical protein
MVVTIFRFTLTPTTTVVCFRWVMISGSIVLYMLLHDLHSACYCGGSGNHPLGLPLITAIDAMALFYSGSLVGGVLYSTCIPTFWFDDVTMTSPALLNDVDKRHFDC